MAARAAGSPHTGGVAQPDRARERLSPSGAGGARGPSRVSGGAVGAAARGAPGKGMPPPLQKCGRSRVYT